MSIINLADKVDNSNVVGVLERWLEWAKAGEVTPMTRDMRTRRPVMTPAIASDESGLEQSALSGCLHDLARDVGAHGQREV